MLSCCQCEGLERQFGAKTVARELRHYRRRGAARTTRLLIDAIRNVGVAGVSLLDIGGGVGAIHHALLDSGADRATHIDISADFLEAAERETARRGHSDRVRFVLGDFVQLASSVDPADIVTLDRVICCYPDMESLVTRAAQRARRVVGAVYPRASWWVRAGVRLTNALMRVRRCPFRVYLHSPLAIDAAFSGQGLSRSRTSRTLIWEVVVYTRPMDTTRALPRDPSQESSAEIDE